MLEIIIALIIVAGIAAFASGSHTYVATWFRGAWREAGCIIAPRPGETFDYDGRIIEVLFVSSDGHVNFIFADEDRSRIIDRKGWLRMASKGMRRV